MPEDVKKPQPPKPEIRETRPQEKSNVPTMPNHPAMPQTSPPKKD